MANYEFKCTQDDGSEMVIRFSATTLGEMFEKYEYFLRACEYEFDGKVGIYE